MGGLLGPLTGYTKPKSPFLVVGCGGPLALAGAKGADFFGANPRRNRSGIGLPAPSGGAMRMEGVGSAIGGPSGR